MQVVKLPENIIRKSNELVVACHKLNLSEQRLLVLLTSAISPDDEDFKDYELRVSDFAEMFNLELSGLYVDLQNAAQSLMKQQIKFNGDNEVEVINWLSYIKYMKGSGIVKLRFDKALKPYLLQLKSHYTQYKLSSVVAFKCQYSMRIYELLKMEAFKANKRGQFERFFEISELRSILGVDDKVYPVFADFKRYLIEPAMREVTKETDLTIDDIKYGKTGRKITNVIFVVTTRCSDDEKKVLKTDQNTKPEVHRLIEALPPDKKSEVCPVINSLVEFGISLPVANTIKNTHDVEKINRNIAYTVAKKQAGEIKRNFAGYLNSAIEKDYGAAANQGSLFDVVSSVAIATKSISRNNGEKNEKDKMKQVLHDFSLLPQDRQEEIQNEFLARCCKSDAAAELIMKQSKIDGKSFYSYPVIEFRLLKFIIDNKIC
ncbi:MAG TPA: replication protein RepB [Cytophagales bacterium]|nr:replication protein RepB [Cytophagales bacterium]